MNKTPTITIDPDKKCKSCGKRGATQSGICLKCVVKRLKQGKEDAHGH